MVLEDGINFTVCDDVCYYPFSSVLFNISFIKQEGRTAFMIASWWGHLKSAVELLSVTGADGHTHNQVCIYGIL